MTLSRSSLSRLVSNKKSTKRSPSLLAVRVRQIMARVRACSALGLEVPPTLLARADEVIE